MAASHADPKFSPTAGAAGEGMLEGGQRILPALAHAIDHLLIARRGIDRDWVALREGVIHGLHAVSDAAGLFQQVLDLRILPLDVVERGCGRLFELLD